MEKFLYKVSLKPLKESSDVSFSRALPQCKHLNLIPTEPILQWHLGSVMTKNDVRKLYPHVVDLTVTKCPCANDVALLGFILNATLDGEFTALWNVGRGVLYFLTAMFNWQCTLNA